MPSPPPPPLSRALTLLRVARGLSPAELAAAGGVPYKGLLAWEAGSPVLQRERLEALVAALDLPPEAIDRALVFLRFVSPEGEVRSGEEARIERDAARLGLAGTERAFHLGLAEVRRSRWRRARERAAAQWQGFRGRPFAEVRLVAEHDDAFWSWAFCERLCAVSRKAAARSAPLAQAWADLALSVARRVKGGEVHPSRLEGYCLGHWGNARRVANDHADAERAFQRTWELWRDMGKQLRDEVLDVSWILGSEASLRRDQRRLPESLHLLDQALSLAQSEKARTTWLINKANALDRLGDYETALAVLCQVGELAAFGDPQLVLHQRYALAKNLGRVSRYTEAESLLPQIREMALELNNDLELTRVLWLEGWIAAGLGRIEHAQLALEQVQRDFLARDLAYDAALVSLDLAVVYLEENNIVEVQNLALEMTPVFTSRQVHKEALAALGLFRAATERGEITLELARRLVRYLERARHDPEQRFEP